MTTPRASIVIPCHNALDYTRACVESIERHTSEPHEIVLVDNGSADGTPEWFAERGEGALVRNPTNLGFAAAVNQGIAAAAAATVVLLNNDALATPGWMTALLAALERDPGIGIAAPMSNYVGGAQLLPAAELGYERAPGPELDRFAAERNARLAGQGFEAERVMGLCMAIRREVVEAIGGFDPVFRIGNYEDDDYCVRARLAGFGLWVCRDSFVHDFGSTTFRMLPEDYRRLLHENGLRFCAKWDVEMVDGRAGPVAERPFDPRRHVVPLPALG